MNENETFVVDTHTLAWFVIVATARTYEAKVLTKDEKITKSGVVEVIW